MRGPEEHSLVQGPISLRNTSGGHRMNPEPATFYDVMR